MQHLPRSAGVVVRDVDVPVARFVSTCDVGVGPSCSSSDDGDGRPFTSDSNSHDGQYPNPDHVPDLAMLLDGVRVQFREIARFPRYVSGWLCDPKWGHRPSSVRARPPSGCGSFSFGSSLSSHSVGSIVMREGFDEEFVRWYHPHLREGGQQMPANARMFNKWLPALLGRCCIGEVVRRNSVRFVRHLEGRRSNVLAADMRVHAVHHVGMNCHCHGVPPPLPSYVRIVYIDVRMVRWCSVGSVPFHSFAWPTFEPKKAEAIARTMLINHCGWANVLVVRGRC